MDAGGGGIGIGIFFGFLGLLYVGAFAWWIYTIVEVVRIPEPQYRVAGTDKTVWVIVVAVGGIIGAVAWLVAKRRDVLAAEGQVPPTPAGWYWLPDGSEMRWWNGSAWTEHVHRPPPPVDTSVT
jgi:hypothetical protein